jgi:hypothetical protein
VANDKAGSELKAGDQVTLTGVVDSVSAGDDNGVNVRVTGIRPSHVSLVYTDGKTLAKVGGGPVEKAGPRMPAGASDEELNEAARRGAREVSGGKESRSLTDMTVAELRDLASEEGIDLTGKTKKDETVQAILDARARFPK